MVLFIIGAVVGLIFWLGSLLPWAAVRSRSADKGHAMSTERTEHAPPSG